MTTIRKCLFCGLGCIAALVVLTGCASTTATRIGTAATTPLADLNVTREDVPVVLLAALKNPYQLPASQNCVALSLEIRALDEVLGADLDAVVSPTDLSLVHRVSSLAQDQAVGVLQRTAEGLIPFRGWVRKLSGAERHSKHVSACIAAGSVRRAFLKGFASAQNCPWRDAAGAVAAR